MENEAEKAQDASCPGDQLSNTVGNSSGDECSFQQKSWKIKINFWISKAAEVEERKSNLFPRKEIFMIHMERDKN